MIDSYLVLPPIVDMMLDWVDSGKPLPKAVDDSFRLVLTKDTVAGSGPSVQPFPFPLPPLVQPFPPLPPPSLAATPEKPSLVQVIYSCH